MTFGQLLNMVETHNDRSRREYEAAEEQRQLAEQGYVQPNNVTPRDLNDPSNLPKVSDIKRVFGGAL